MNNGQFKILSLLTVLCCVLIFSCNVEKPSPDGHGELALQVPAGVDVMPWFHLPIDKFRGNHMNLIRSGKVSAEGCLTCHSEPNKFCNKCHDYVGVKHVFTDTAGKPLRDQLNLSVDSAIPPPDNHKDLEKWRTTHDNVIINGEDNIKTCLGCHSEPDNFCNQCHAKIGIRKITK
ncbi:MAG: hypothetical protein HQL06_13605 [Nitrospirae bacterium]|nr:hypothetical protein [Nitrospirota bacterium]